MKWTKTKPTEPGYYRFKTPKGQRTVISVEDLAKSGRLIMYFTGVGGGIFVKDALEGTLFAGPIEEPSDKDPLENLQYAHVGLREDCPYD